MTILSANTTIPDTLRTLSANTDKYKITDSLFITPSDFVCTTDELEDRDFWYDNLGINLFPLHRITNYTNESTKNQITESLQRFGYKTAQGKYKFRYNFDWSLDYHNLIDDLSGQKVNVILISGNVIRTALKSDGNIKGLTVDLFDLEPILFDDGNGSGNSELFIELAEINKSNETICEVEVDWIPGKINREVLNIDITFGDDSMTLLIKHLSNTVSGIKASDITITDDINGDISFNTYIPGNGVYKLIGFDKTITTACMYIQSTIYIGAKRFAYNYIVVITNNMVTEYGDNMVTEYGNNMTLEN